jgi:hypothetical protein
MGGKMSVYFGLARIILPPWCVATRLVPTQGLVMRGKHTAIFLFVKRFGKKCRDFFKLLKFKIDFA